MTDYCDTEIEVAKTPKAKAWIEAIAKGDENVFEFCWVMWNFANVYDDLVDQDYPVTQAMAGKTLADLFRVLTFNPFYQAYKAHLFGLIVSALDRWVESELLHIEAKTSDESAAASVVRCGAVDLFSQVAYLHGGWEHMRAMRGLRSYDLPDKRES